MCPCKFISFFYFFLGVLIRVINRKNIEIRKSQYAFGQISYPEFFIELLLFIQNRCKYQQEGQFLSENKKIYPTTVLTMRNFFCNITSFFSCSLKPHGPVVEDVHISSLPIKGISAIPSYYPYNSITAHPKEKLNSGYRRRNGEPSPSLAFPGTSTQRGYELYQA